MVRGCELCPLYCPRTVGFLEPWLGCLWRRLVGDVGDLGTQRPAIKQDESMG